MSLICPLAAQELVNIDDMSIQEYNGKVGRWVFIPSKQAFTSWLSQLGSVESEVCDMNPGAPKVLNRYIFFPFTPECIKKLEEKNMTRKTASSEADQFIWPLGDVAQITSVLGFRGREFHTGIDIPAALAHTAANGGLKGFGGAAPIDPEEFWRLECEFLVPAALEGQLTVERASHARARIVVEGANGPTTPAADDILHERGILVVPDVLANAGGVTVSYFEWVQDFSSFFWTEDEINERLERIMVAAFTAIWKVAQEKQVSLRTAAFIIACARVLEARAERGLYP